MKKLIMAVGLVSLFIENSAFAGRASDACTNQVLTEGLRLAIEDAGKTRAPRIGHIEYQIDQISSDPLSVNVSVKFDGDAESDLIPVSVKDLKTCKIAR